MCMAEAKPGDQSKYNVFLIKFIGDVLWFYDSAIDLQISVNHIVCLKRFLKWNEIPGLKINIFYPSVRMSDAI